MKAEGRDQVSDLFRASYLLDDSDMCVNPRARRVICTDCEKACPVKVIKPGIDAIALNEDDCTLCGACVPACPSAALRLSVFDPIRFLEAAAQMDELHVHCPESRDGGGGIVIPCHLAIDARLAAVATKGGRRDLILHGRPLCHECARADAREHAPALTRELKRWFGPNSRSVRWARPGEEAQDKSSQHMDQAQANRRNFLRLAGARAISNISWLVPTSSGAVAEPQGIFVPGDFKRREDPYQSALAKTGGVYAWLDGTLLPFMIRNISDACSHCGICADRCPTAALTHAHGPGWQGIDYEALSCTNCGLCTAICPDKAITAKVATNWEMVIEPRQTLIRRELDVCARCGQPFKADEQTMCPACNKETDVDADWMAMLGG
ncbi:MAG: 4Fe-4S binding protein [Alphaproteobacteria bacterium]|nr:4Fe-4S binding protein [Alphaproteobacteria bacterium]